MSRESIEFDVVVVGGGPAGLAAACRLGQLCSESGHTLEVAVLEKGSQIGAHIVSGAIFETRALDELFPDWRSRGAPVTEPVGRDRLDWLIDAERSLRVPHAIVPPSLRNDHNFIISLGELCEWLARQAEALGVHVLAGHAATGLLFDEAERRVIGVVTGPHGLDREGRAKPGAEPGYDVHARQVILAEGCRGSLTEELIARCDLRRHCDPQHYGIGFKETWVVEPQMHEPGLVCHTLGWPLGRAAGGGGFMYHSGSNAVAVGLIVDLSYRNPHLDPFREFQRFKQHPLIRERLRGAERTGFAARAVAKGGFTSLPDLECPGATLVGCAAGFLNPAKIKGTHTAMKSGMLAAEAAFVTLTSGDTTVDSFAMRVHASWVWEELKHVRNFAPAVARLGPLLGGVIGRLEQTPIGPHLPQLRNFTHDRATLLSAQAAVPIEYPSPDGVISFDRASSVYLANIRHEENQPCHLVLVDPSIPTTSNLREYDEPAQRYCPAGVYEIVRDADGGIGFQINAANCIHCKTCDIKDPARNIEWRPPEGGSGPNYARM
jgi:electron-transferring-flavoprotein dehydrogenase